MPPSGIGLDDIADLEHLFDRDRRLAVGMRFGRMFAPGRYLARFQIDGRDMGSAGLAVEQRDRRLPRQLAARLPAEDCGLGRLFELDMREAAIRTKLLVGPQQVACQRDLGLAERVERMVDRRRLFRHVHIRTLSYWKAG